MEENNALIVIPDDSQNTKTELDRIFRKSNYLISAKYKASLTENKIMALAMSDKNRMMEDSAGTIRVEIPTYELKAALKGRNNGSFYQKIKVAANSLNKRQIGMIDDERGQFRFYQIIQTCIFENGILRITFNSDIGKNLIKDVTNKFSLLSLKTLLSFKKEYAFRLYELAKSKAYNEKGENYTSWTVIYDLAELMFIMGVADAQDEKAQKILSDSKNPEYKKAIDKAKIKKSLTEWSEFKRSVLIPAVKEINGKSDLNISVEPEKNGVGGRVTGVKLVITYKDIIVENANNEEIEENTDYPEYKVEELEEKHSSKPDPETLDAFIDTVADMIDEKLKMADIRAICREADYDLDRIEEAYKYVKSKSKVDDLVAYLINAIRNRYAESPKVSYVNEKKTKKSKVNFTQRDSNFNEIAENLIKNQKPLGQ